VEEDQHERDQHQHRIAGRLVLEVRQLDHEVRADHHGRAEPEHELVGDARERHALRHALALGHDHPPHDHQRVRGHVARQERLAPDRAGRPRPQVGLAERVDHEAPDLALEHVEAGHAEGGQDQPGRLEVPLEVVRDRVPLPDDEEDEEGEDQPRQAPLQSQAQPRVALPDLPDAGGLVSGSFEQCAWLSARFVSREHQ
jgi:hypothetical protein